MAQLCLALAVVGLGSAVLWLSTGALGRVAAELGSSLAGLTSVVQPAPTDSPSAAPLPDAPVLISSTGYTNQPMVGLSGTLPTEVAGSTDRVRIYRILTKATNPPTLVRELPVGQTPEFSVSAVLLAPGIDFFTATLIGPAGETPPSVPVRVVYYSTPPEIVVTSPQTGQTVSGPTVTLTGRTRAGTLIVARNEANGGSVTGTAGGDDTFSLTIALEPGTNGITLTATDPAGNTASLVVSVLGGTGKLTVTLTPSAYQFSAAQLPTPVTFTIVVTDPAGHPVTGASLTLTLTLPGSPPTSQQATTDDTGTAIVATTLPSGTAHGSGVATVVVQTGSFGSVSARAVFSIGN